MFVCVRLSITTFSATTTKKWTQTDSVNKPASCQCQASVVLNPLVSQADLFGHLFVVVAEAVEGRVC